MAFAQAVLGTCCSRSVARVLLATLLIAIPIRTSAGPGGEGHTHDGEGHTHGDEAATPSAVSPRVAMPGELYDVVAIYKGGRLTFYVDRLSDNAPVTDAKLEVTAGSKQFELAAGADGTFATEAGELAGGGSQELIVSIQAPGGDDLVGGTLDIPSSAGAGKGQTDHGVLPALRPLWSQITSISGAGAAAIFAGGLLVGLLCGSLVARRRIRPAMVLLFVAATALPARGGPGGEGHAHGNDASAQVVSDAPHRLPDGSVFLPKPTQRLLEVRTAVVENGEVRRTVALPGRIIASPHQSGIVQSINGGRISIAGGRLPTLGQRVKQGELLAIVEPPVNAADETTIADKLGEITQQITVAEIRLNRLIPLAAANAVPKSQITDLQAELEALRNRQANIPTRRRQPEELRAPVDGEVAAVRVVAGQVVASQDQVFHIVDPRAMWVEAFAFDGLDPSNISTAVAVGNDNRSLKLKFEGVGRVLQLHATQLQFSIENPPVTLMVGQPATALVQTKEVVTGIVLPREAVVRATNGEMVVWQRAASERFVPKPVRGQLVNGEQFVVLAGLEAGQRVVIKGAELVNQVR
jgi:cobalt-zinc-cadmium efflux system membrane fusion protein